MPNGGEIPFPLPPGVGDLIATGRPRPSDNARLSGCRMIMNHETAGLSNKRVGTCKGEMVGIPGRLQRISNEKGCRCGYRNAYSPMKQSDMIFSDGRVMRRT